MLSGLRPFGPDGISRLDLDAMSLGVAEKHVLPEDGLERQTLATDDGRFALAFDGRIDNRSEVAGKLRIDAAALARKNDAWLMLELWRRSAWASFDHVIGDFALALWDTANRSLILARSPFSMRPLFYHRGKSFLAFASMPAGIFQLPEVQKALNWEAVAVMGSGAMRCSDPITLFEGIRRVPPGMAIEFTRDGKREVRLLDLGAIAVRHGSIGEFGEELRAEFGRAVAARLRRREGGVATHLSAGRDSSAVTSTAAMALAAKGQQLIALTAAPSEGFADGAGMGWLVDESVLAAATAAGHSNIRHLICRPDGRPLESQIDELHRHHFAPLITLSNMPWHMQLNGVAAHHGASVLLAGWNGNFSISSGGDGYLIDLLRERGLLAWLRHAGRIAGMSPSHWLRLGYRLGGPWLPRTMHARLFRLAGRSLPGFSSLPTLKPPLRHRAESVRRERYWDWRPPRSYRDLIKFTLEGIDDSELISSTVYGLDVRDPTSDRRVIELCLSLPSSAMFAKGSERPVYESAFRDRIPAEVLHNRQRGYQTADWFQQFRPEAIRTAFRRYNLNPLVREIIDLGYIEEQLDRWPASGWQVPVIESYRNQLLGTLAIASFVDTHFPA